MLLKGFSIQVQTLLSRSCTYVSRCQCYISGSAQQKAAAASWCSGCSLTADDALLWARYSIDSSEQWGRNNSLPQQPTVTPPPCPTADKKPLIFCRMYWDIFIVNAAYVLDVLSTITQWVPTQPSNTPSNCLLTQFYPTLPEKASDAIIKTVQCWHQEFLCISTWDYSNFLCRTRLFSHKR